MPKLISGLVAALATKTAAGLTVAALAAGATGAVVVGVQTGAVQHFSESMKANVAQCKSEAPTNGQHGIGTCVSSFARHHGSDARANNPGQGNKGTGKPDETGKPDGAGKPDQTGKPASLGHSGDHPGAKPSSKPGDGVSDDNPGDD